MNNRQILMLLLAATLLGVAWTLTQKTVFLVVALMLLILAIAFRIIKQKPPGE